MFANDNKMVSVWCHGMREYFAKEKFVVEGFDPTAQDVIPDGFNEIHSLEAHKGEKIINE